MIISEKQILQLMSLVRFIASSTGLDQDMRKISAKLLDEIQRQQSEQLKDYKGL